MQLSVQPNVHRFNSLNFDVDSLNFDVDSLIFDFDSLNFDAVLLESKLTPQYIHALNLGLLSTLW